MNSTDQNEFGIIGMGVMGKSLAINFANNKIMTAVYNRHVPGSEEEVATKFAQEYKHLANLTGYNNIQDFISSLGRPRKILLMVSAGKAIDSLISQLMPLLDEGDIIIDGGNSHYEDSAKRHELLKKQNLHFLGMGISGGEEGALKGPSLMPGGSKEAYTLCQKYFEKLAAKDHEGKPCCAYIGSQGAGHFVKMVHNGIEYAEMQLLAEVYGILHRYLQKPYPEISGILNSWKAAGLNSYLLEITADILVKKEGTDYLLDKVLDSAAQKGTGGWSTQAALKTGVVLSSISESVMARYMSAMKNERTEASNLYAFEPETKINNKETFIADLREAYRSARIINHAIGFDLIQKTSNDLGWKIDLASTARVWTNGCIIRSDFMSELIDLFKENGDKHLLLNKSIAHTLKECNRSHRKTVSELISFGHSATILTSTQNYLSSFTTANSTANMIQAQRDYFGAHTYQRIDAPFNQSFHSNWSNND